MQPAVLTVQLKTLAELEYSDLCVFSPQWERKEAGGGVPHLQLEMKDVVGAILPTLPQSPRSPQNPPALHPPRHKTHPKTAARRRRRPRARRRRRPRARRTIQLQEGKKCEQMKSPRSCAPGSERRREAAADQRLALFTCRVSLTSVWAQLDLIRFFICAFHLNAGTIGRAFICAPDCS